MSGIAEAMNDALENQLNAIRFNLKQEFGGLLYALKLELEKQGDVGIIEEFIDMIISTSEYAGPEGEEYPTWIAEGRHLEADSSVRARRAQQLRAKLASALLVHGIEQSWNIGSKVLQEQDRQRAKT